jgi:hypothetical protein
MSSSAAIEAFLAEPRNVIVAGIRKDGRQTPPDDELAAQLIADDRVLLVFTPSAPASAWTSMNIR